LDGEALNWISTKTDDDCAPKSQPAIPDSDPRVQLATERTLLVEVATWKSGLAPATASSNVRMFIRSFI